MIIHRVSTDIKICWLTFWFSIAPMNSLIFGWVSVKCLYLFNTIQFYLYCTKSQQMSSEGASLHHLKDQSAALLPGHVLNVGVLRFVSCVLRASSSHPVLGSSCWPATIQMRLNISWMWLLTLTTLHVTMKYANVWILMWHTQYGIDQDSWAASSGFPTAAVAPSNHRRF